MNLKRHRWRSCALIVDSLAGLPGIALTAPGVIYILFAAGYGCNL